MYVFRTRRMGEYAYAKGVLLLHGQIMPVFWKYGIDVLLPEAIDATDITVLNDPDRFHLVHDAIKQLPQLGESGAKLKKTIEKKLIEHTKYVDKNGVDMPEILN